MIVVPLLLFSCRKEIVGIWKSFKYIKLLNQNFSFFKCMQFICGYVAAINNPICQKKVISRTLFYSSSWVCLSLQARPSWTSHLYRSHLSQSSLAVCGWAQAVVPFSASRYPRVCFEIDTTSTFISYCALSSVNCINHHLQHQKMLPSHLVPLNQPSCVSMDTDKLLDSSLLHLVEFWLECKIFIY